MYSSSLFAAIAIMTLATRLAFYTEAFSYFRIPPRLLPSSVALERRLPLFLHSSLVFCSSSSDSGGSLSARPPAAYDDAQTVSPTTERMRVESEQEMSRILERLSNANIIPTTTTLPTDTRRLPILCTTQDHVAAYMKEHSIDSILFDCDGVVYRSPDPAPGARACIQSLALFQNKRVFFVTNNAASNRAQLRDKLASILDMDHHYHHHDNDENNHDSKVVLTQNVMVPSSFSAAQYLKQHLLNDMNSNSSAASAATTTGRLFVIGSQGLVDELRQACFTIVGCGSDNEKTSMTRDELANYDFRDLHPIDAVVVGHDTNLHFRKLAIAQVLLQKNPNALLVATNTDAYDLVGVHGYEIPGNGGAVKYLEWTSRRTAINCGKPSPILATVLHDLYGLDTSRAIFVGDRLDTDIQFGINTGMHTALVLTGVTSGHQMADILIQQQQQQDESTTDSSHAIPSIILPHIGLLA